MCARFVHPFSHLWLDSTRSTLALCVVMPASCYINLINVIQSVGACDKTIDWSDRLVICFRFAGAWTAHSGTIFFLHIWKLISEQGVRWKLDEYSCLLTWITSILLGPWISEWLHRITYYVIYIPKFENLESRTYPWICFATDDRIMTLIYPMWFFSLFTYKSKCKQYT